MAGFTMRRWPLATAVMLVTLGSVGFFASPVSAKSNKFIGAAPGSVTCSFLGKISFSPALKTSGGGTGPSKISGTTLSCTTTDTAVSVSGGKIKGSFASSPLICAGPSAVLTSATLKTTLKGSVNGVIGGTTYSGKAKFSPSTVTYSGADFVDSVGGQGLAMPGSGDSSSVSGSFGDAGPKGSLAVFQILGGISAGCGSPKGIKNAVIVGTIIEGSVSPGAVSCCLVGPGSPNIAPLEPGYDLADPTIASLSPTMAEVYTTDCYVFQGCSINGLSYNIPSYSVNVTNDTYGNLHDALPTPPSWYGGEDHLFAPTVRFIDGQYVMLFAASPTGSNALCIGEATSPDGITFQPVNSVEVCGSGVSLYDPQLFVNPSDGSVWAFYSLESGVVPGIIQVQQLSADASSLVGSPTTMLTYSQVASVNPNEGSRPFLENPAFVVDPTNGYGFDLLASLGQYNGLDTYATIEVPCTSVTGGCQPSQAQVVMGPGYGDDPGSAAIMNDSSPSGNLIVWDQWINGQRMDFIGPTTAF